MPTPTAKRTPSQVQADLVRLRAESAERRARERAILGTAVDLRRHQAAVEALERLLLRGRSFVLDTFADLALPHVWAVDATGGILGHVLTVAGGVFADAAAEDRLVVLPLPDALNEPWSDAAERAEWTAAYTDALRRIADHAEGAEKALQDRAELFGVLGRDIDG